jgi:hypothetical protein
VIDAAKDAGCTDIERDHALWLLSTYQGTAKALGYCLQCEAAHRVAAAQVRCPYMGEF